MRRLWVCLSGATLLFLAGCNSGSKPISVTILSPTGAQAIDIGQAFNISVRVNNDKLNKGASFTMTGVGALSSQTTTAATYAAPTNGTGGNATIAVASLSDPTKSIALNVIVTAVPNISNASSSLAAAIQGTAYNASITVTGGAGTLTYSITSGSLPAGLALNSSTGAITGTPTGPNGTANFTVQVKDSSTVSPQTSSKAFSIAVDQQPAITSANSTTFTLNTLGTFTVTTTAAPTAAISETGVLPTGVTLVDNGNGSATLSGTSTTSGTFPITITANNGIGTNATQNFTLIIGQAAAITSAAATTFTVASVGNFSVTTTGYPSPSLTETGALPGGVTFVDNGNGSAKLSGTPASGSGGSYPITIKAHNGVGADATQKFILTVNQQPAITSANSASFAVGGAVSFTVTTSAFPAPAITETGALPAGVTFVDNGNGTAKISGSASASGSFPITITANNGIGTAAAQKFTLTITTAPVFTSGNSTTFTVGSVGTFTVTLTGSPTPTLKESGALPTGVTFVDNGNGTATLAGTPASGSGATYSLTFTAHNGAGPDATQNFTLTVNQAPAITSANSTTFTIGMSGTSFTVTTTGFPTAALSETGALPGGVTFVDNGNGSAKLSGTPAPGTANSYPLTITANNGVAPNGTQAFTLTVNPAAAIVITPATGSALPNAAVGQFYSTTIGATGGVQPYTFSIDASGTQLPTGLSINSSTGQISGTPAAAANLTNIVLDVTDSSLPPTVQKATYSLTISATSACTTMGHESLLNGQYALLLKGFDNAATPEPVLIGGVLTFNGSGTITAATVDTNGNSTAGVSTKTLTSGSYGVGSDQRGCMVVTTSAGTQNYRFSLGNISSGVASAGHVIDFGTTGPFTAGIMRKQDSAAFGTGSSQVTGNYAFGVSSAQNTASCNGGVCGGKFAAVGVFNFSGGNVSGGEVDFNTNGQLDGNSANTTWPASPVSFTSGSYTVSNTNGRGTLSFTPSGSTAVHAIIYVVSSSEVLVMASDDQTLNSLFAGELLQQTGTPFSSNPLSGTYIGYDSGLGNGGTGTGRTDIFLLGPLTSGSNALSGTQLRNDSGVFSSGSISGTYGVASTGRMAVTSGGHPPILYLVNTSQAFSLNSNPDVDSGFFQLQSGSPFTNSSASGAYAYGAISPESSTSADNAGIAVFASPNVNVTEDKNNSGSLSAGFQQQFTYSVDSTGLGSIPSGCPFTASSTTCNTFFYIVSPTKAVIMGASSGSPKIQIADK